MIPPESCRDMDELRRQIDALDADLVAHLALRARYIDRAAELKAGEGLPARIPARVDQVLEHVQDKARSEGLDPELAAELWRALIEWSIGREEVALAAKEVRE